MRPRISLAGAGLAALALAAAPTPSIAKTFVIPHIIDTKDAVTWAELSGTGAVPGGVDLLHGKGKKADAAIDTAITMTYIGGLPGAASGGGAVSASVALYLYDATGDLLKSALGTDVCGPCDYPIGGAAPRKRTVVLDSEITAKGGHPSTVVLGFGVLVVSGDVDNVNIQSFVTNAKSSSLDLAVFGFEPQPISASTP